MARFRTKYAEIHAWKYGHDLSEMWPRWLRDAWTHETFVDVFGEDPHAVIKTPEGEMRVNVGTWIIQGTEGELYPCKDSVFQRKYEPVEVPGVSRGDAR